MGLSAGRDILTVADDEDDLSLPAKIHLDNRVLGVARGLPMLGSLAVAEQRHGGGAHVLRRFGDSR